MPRRRLLAMTMAAALLAAATRSASAQDLTWKNGLTFYLDNTEFFNPYRTGETLLGGQVLSYLSAVLGPRTEVVAGFHGNHESGDSRFLSPFKPILGFRYRTDHSLGAIGTLVTEDRHGYLEPLEGALLDITRPVEYGVQWREQHTAGGGEVFLNWQRLNTSTRAGVFDYGLLLHANPSRWLRLELQGTVSSRRPAVQRRRAGSQQPGLALGGQLSARCRSGASSLRAFQLLSHGDIDSLRPGRPDHGHGTYFRAAFTPGNWWSCSRFSGGAATSWPTRGTTTTARRAPTWRITSPTASTGGRPGAAHAHRVGPHARHRVPFPPHRRPPQHRDRESRRGNSPTA